MPRIVFYVTSHGFGHATREIEIINHIPEEIEVEIVTSVPEWLFQRSLHRRYSYHELCHDPGVVQRDSLAHDLPQTRIRWNETLDQYPVRVQHEMERWGGEFPDVVVGDISPFAVAVGLEAGKPSIMVANFSWDWIFPAFVPFDPSFEEIIERIKGYYRNTSLLLRTPLSGDLSIFPEIVDVPLITRRSRKTRPRARRAWSPSPARAKACPGTRPA